MTVPWYTSGNAQTGHNSWGAGGSGVIVNVVTEGGRLRVMKGNYMNSAWRPSVGFLTDRRRRRFTCLTLSADPRRGDRHGTDTNGPGSQP
jgi:hypothetical protein